MDKKIIDFLTTEWKMGRWRLTVIDLLLFLAAPVFAVMMRVSIMGYTSLELPTFLRLNPGLKIATAVFDLALALLGAFFVLHWTKSKRRAFLTYAILLLLPVLSAGSGMWGMGDSIYVFFALLSLYLLMTGKGNASLVSYGISLFLSRYAFFLLPIYAIAFMQKKNKLIYFLFPLCGAWFRNGLVQMEGYIPFPIFELERLLSKMRGENLLSYNWPNLFQMIGADKFVTEYSIVAKSMAAVLMLVVVVLALQRKHELGEKNLVTAALTLSMLFPFIMPHMDERCGLMADILAVIFVMKYMDLFYVAVLQMILSFLAYSAYFRGESVIPLSYVALLALFLIFVMLRFAGNGEKLTISFSNGNKQNYKEKNEL